MTKHTTPHTLQHARHVYLAGPIMGCTEGEANDWRKFIADLLLPHNIVAMSPLRCEPIRGERYSLSSPDPKFGTARAIGAKNRFDVVTCPITIACLPLPAAGRVQSYGTIGEIHWADAYGRQVILCTNDPIIAQHPVIDSACDWKLVTSDCPGGQPEFPALIDTLRGAVEIVIGVLGGYTGGRHV